MEILIRILGKCLQPKVLPSDIEIDNVVIDSREIKKNSLFFAINKGNEYVKEALEKGASFVVCDKNQDITDDRVAIVKDTVGFMQEFAREYRKSLSVKVIGITGSNGKTTTKDMVSCLLSQKYKVKKTEGNHNNQIGVPLTLLNLQDDTEVAVIEMGMSAPGEIDLLSSISLPDYGIITNIGDSHLEFLKTRENVFKAKTEIVKYLAKDRLFISGDDVFLKNIDGIKIGFNENNQYIITDYKEKDGEISFSLNHKEHYTLNINGKHNCSNAAIAIAIAKAFLIGEKEIRNGLRSLQITPMRFEKIEKNDILYINDAYNASPISMDCSLDTYDKLYNDRFKVLVLGDMLELGEKEIKFHKEVLEKALTIKADKIYIYGPRMEKAFNELENNNINITKIMYIDDINIIKKSIDKDNEHNLGKLCVLLKGSRGMKLERIIR